MVVRNLGLVRFENQLAAEWHIGAMAFVVVWTDIMPFPAHRSLFALAIIAGVATMRDWTALHLHLHIEQKHVLLPLFLLLPTFKPQDASTT